MSDVSQVSAPQVGLDQISERTNLDRIVLRRSPDVQSTNMDGETVLLDLSTGRYYTLNSVGSVIWEHCTGQNTLNDMQTVLCDRFNVDSDRAHDDLVTLVHQLVEEGLLQQEGR
jgi:hypothetical protein